MLLLTEQVILLETLHDSRVHITELAAVAFVEDNDHMFQINRMPGILFDKSRKLLDRRDNDPRIIIFQLTLQDHGTGVTIGSAFLETVIFLHSLIVQILAVNHKKNFVDIGQL